MGETLSTHLAIVGGGPGGYAAAFMAADLGLEVTLIGADANPGGTCLYRGCIPSKALLHVAKVLNEARAAAGIGVAFGAPSIDLDKVRASTEAVVENMTKGLGQLCKARKVNYVQGCAKFVDSKTLAVTEDGGGETRLACEHIVLATGSAPITLGGLPDSPRILDSTGALRLAKVPDSLLLIGGGYIGLELGTVYAALGARVTVAEMTDGLLPGADRDLVKPLHKRLEGQFEEILLNTKVAGMTEEADGMAVALEGAGGTRTTLNFEQVLVCVGRRPMSGGLGLEQTRVKVDARGFIEVDAQLRTGEPHIFAIGDLVSGPMLAHKASAEGRTAAAVVAGQDVAFDARAIPAVVFTDPEIAWCGLTETEAKQAGRKIKVGRFPWAASGRAATLHRGDGLTKVICDPETDRVLGIGIAGPGAGELIAEGALALEMGALAEDLELTIHPHPTLSETLMEAAGTLSGTSTHIFRPKRRS